MSLTNMQLSGDGIGRRNSVGVMILRSLKENLKCGGWIGGVIRTEPKRTTMLSANLNPLK